MLGTKQETSNQIAGDRFIEAYFVLFRVSVSLSVAFPFLCAAGTLALAFQSSHSPYGWFPPLLSVAAILVAYITFVFVKPCTYFCISKVEQLSSKLTEQVDLLTGRPAVLSIIAVTAASLLLELSFIRWVAGQFEIFAFYKNFMLLCCFAGLGVGYAGTRYKLVFPAALPAICLTICLVEGLRFGMPQPLQYALHEIPSLDVISMGRPSASNLLHLVANLTLLNNLLFLCILSFAPLGQLCGRLMRQLPNLEAYSANLLGSVLGVCLMIWFSQMWTPPAVWFGAAFLLLLPLLRFDRVSVMLASVTAIISTAVLSAIAPFGSECIYSPYQLLERGRGSHGLEIQIKSAGHYYQRIVDLSKFAQADPYLKMMASYYELPYRFKPAPQEVLVVGAGAGNDVAAALRCGASHVDAVEIDPTIARMGEWFHPEKPYQNPNVHLIVDDARQYLRKSTKKYDAVVFGLLDSHVSTSQASQLRTDSYVYTVESMKDARARLKDDGLMSLSFCSCGPELDQKLKNMVHEAFGTDAVCLRSGYDASLTLLGVRNSALALKALNQITQETNGFVTEEKTNNDAHLIVDSSTDDWPFFYMPHRHLPLSYLPMLALIIVGTGGFLYLFQRPAPGQPSSNPFTLEGFVFLLLGCGFMLIETKSITELSLFFGNTWQVTGIVIVAVLLMAFLSNLVIDRTKSKSLTVPFIGLMVTLAFGLYMHAFQKIPATGVGPLIATIVVTLPMIFSGAVFSTILGRSRSIDQSMSMNLLGALAGGAMEYMALWLGYTVLYWIATGVYLMALLLYLVHAKRKPSEVSG